MSAADDSPTDIVRRQYRDKIGRIAKLPELEMRTASLRETLRELTPKVAVCWIDQLVRGALWGRPPNLNVVLAFAYGLVEDMLHEEDEYTETWRGIAAEHDMRAVDFMLRDLPAHQHLPDVTELPEVRLPVERDGVAVGRRRTLAQKGNRDLIDRLVMDPDPLVIESLLDNPKLEKSDVLRIVTRQPTRPELLHPVALHTGWFGYRGIRKGLAHNPYTPTGLSLKLLPTLGIDVLRRIQHGSSLHPALVDAADHLVSLREKRTAPWEV